MVRWAFWGLFLAAVLVQSCKTGGGLEKSEAARNIEENYRNFKSLQGSFILQGLVNGKAFNYAGKISLSKETQKRPFLLNIEIMDPVFLSPLVSIRIQNSQFAWFNHITQEEKKINYKHSNLDVGHDEPIPLDILIPLITGDLPGPLTREVPQAKNNTHKTKAYRIDSEHWDMTAYFTDFILSELKADSKRQREHLVFLLQGSLSNRLRRVFPRKIKLVFKNREYIEIIYTKVTLSEN